MSTKREDILGIVTMMWVLAMVAACIALVSRCVSNRATIPSETVKRDTIVVRDTVVRVKPEAQVHDSIIVRYVRVPVTVRDTLHVRNTDSVSLPITQKVYGDSLYTAWVSGYEAALDSIHLYRTNTIITDTRTITMPQRAKPKRWGIGIQAGYGMSVERHPQASPYVGVGISYSLFQF